MKLFVFWEIQWHQPWRCAQIQNPSPPHNQKPSASPPSSWPEMNQPRRARLQFQSPVTRFRFGVGTGWGNPPGEPIRPQNHRLPKSNHNHFRFGCAAICKESSNSSLPPRAISSVAVCLFTCVQTIPQSRQRNAGDFNSTFGPNVPQKPRCCGGNSNRHGPSNALSLPSATFWLLQAGHRISISVSK